VTSPIMIFRNADDTGGPPSDRRAESHDGRLRARWISHNCPQFSGNNPPFGSWAD
jgi:hypothetical protein